MENTKLEKEFVLKWRFSARLEGAIWVFAEKSPSTIQIIYKDVIANAKDLMEIYGLKVHALTGEAIKEHRVKELTERVQKISAAGDPERELYLHAGDRIKLVIQGPDAATVMGKLTQVFTYGECEDDGISAMDFLHE